MVAVLAGVIVAAVFAMRHAPTLVSGLVEDLPDCATCVDNEPSPAECLAAGGTVRYRRTNECFTEPGVHDVCGLGVPCFTSGDNGYCRDVRDPYCHCEADDQCPEGYDCQFSERSADGKTFEPVLESGQCWPVARNSTEPEQALRATPL